MISFQIYEFTKISTICHQIHSAVATRLDSLELFFVCFSEKYIPTAHDTLFNALKIST